MRAFLLGFVFLVPAIARAEPELGQATVRLLPARPAHGQLAPLVAEANSFVGFFRDPAETPNVIDLVALDPDGQGGTQAYFRDALIDARTMVTDAVDQDTWTAVMLLPDGRLELFDTIKFYTAHPVIGQPNCFVNLTSGAFRCGSTNAEIDFFRVSQCDPVGQWDWSFRYNNALWAERQHLFQPRLPPGTVHALYQGLQPQWGGDDYDGLCTTNGLAPLDCVMVNVDGTVDRDKCTCPDPLPAGWGHKNVADEGCYMTAVVEATNYGALTANRAPLTPHDFNELASLPTGDQIPGFRPEEDGYDINGDVKFFFAHKFAADFGIELAITGDRIPALDPSINAHQLALDALICKNGPQLLHTSPTHWVAAVGRHLDTAAFIVADPGNGQERDATNPTLGGRVVAGPGTPLLAIRNEVILNVQSPVELLLTDPNGLRTGFDPATGQSFSEIPQTIYEHFGIDNAIAGTEGAAHATLHMLNGAAGMYALKVTGIGNGSYLLYISAEGLDNHARVAAVKNVPITTGESHFYAFNFDESATNSPVFVGGFDGGGQRPRDVNKFLTYIVPAGPKTVLSAGARSATVVVSYGATTIPSSFTAVLNGTNVATLFHPAAGKTESVSLPVASGSNPLKLSIQGTLATGRVATDSDTLTFSVP